MDRARRRALARSPPRVRELELGLWSTGGPERLRRLLGRGGWGSCNAACASEHAAHVSIAWKDRKSVMNRQDCSHEARSDVNSGRFSSVFKMCWSNPEDARLAFCCDAPYVRRVTRDWRRMSLPFLGVSSLNFGPLFGAAFFRHTIGSPLSSACRAIRRGITKW